MPTAAFNPVAAAFEASAVAFDASAIEFDASGLVPAIVQDRADGRVLMLAWMDAEALEATLHTGEVHFHSRSQGRLWRKGETSGNVLRLVDIAEDCDRDALLVTADPVGPTCHRGTRSCFDDDPADDASATRDIGFQGFVWLETLWSTIAERAKTRPEGSYTAKLLEGGVDAVSRKVAEEAIEVVLAAKDDASASDPTDRTRAALAGEAADLLYHSLVLLAEREIDPRAVLDVLRERHAG
jgi:phosphoribosyl-ATP pyrophosphohydrolase/phosphoribosyl-AMP cyclohydrolase